MEIEIQSNIAVSYFRFDDFESIFKNFLAESWHGVFENLIKEWNIWIFEEMPKAAKVQDWEHVLHCCFEIKSLIEKILQIFLQLFQDNSSFKTVAEKVHDKVKENRINIMSLTSYIHSLSNRNFSSLFFFQ